MEEKFRLGIIGFGEVGFAMAVGLKERLGQIAIYDVLLNKDPENKLLKERIKKAQVNPYTNPAQAAEISKQAAFLAFK